MAATRGTLQGYGRASQCQQGAKHSLGHGAMEARADTWQTFATVTINADGHGELIVKRHGKVIALATWDAEEASA